MTQDIRTHIADLLRVALKSLAPEAADTPIVLDRPKQASHGDFASNLALQIAKIIRLEVHAPAAEIEKLRAPMASLNPQFFALEPGIRRANAA